MFAFVVISATLLAVANANLNTVNLASKGYYTGQARKASTVDGEALSDMSSFSVSDIAAGADINTRKQWIIGDGGTGCSKDIFHVCNRWLYPEHGDGSGVPFENPKNAGTRAKWNLEKVEEGVYKIYFVENPHKFYWKTVDSYGPNNYLKLSTEDPGDLFKITEVAGKPGVYTITAKKNCPGTYPCDKKITFEKEWGQDNYWLKTDPSEAATFKFCSDPCPDNILTPGYTEEN